MFIVETGRMGTALPEQAASGTLPPRVQTVVATRLVQLSEDAREVAGLAAVIGRVSHVECSPISDLEEDAVVRALR